MARRPGSTFQAAMDGFGLVCLPAPIVASKIRQKRLIQVMMDWCPPFPGFHLYYPNRRQNSPALMLLAEALRWTGHR